jgi:sugar lactone lactonase YvrE
VWIGGPYTLHAAVYSSAQVMNYFNQYDEVIIPAGVTVNILAGETLVVPVPISVPVGAIGGKGGTLTNNGAISGGGTLLVLSNTTFNNGVNGTIDGLTLINGDADSPGKMNLAGIVNANTITNENGDIVIEGTVRANAMTNAGGDISFADAAVEMNGPLTVRNGEVTLDRGYLRIDSSSAYTGPVVVVEGGEFKINEGGILNGNLFTIGGIFSVDGGAAGATLTGELVVQDGVTSLANCRLFGQLNAYDGVAVTLNEVDLLPDATSTDPVISIRGSDCELTGGSVGGDLLVDDISTLSVNPGDAALVPIAGSVTVMGDSQTELNGCELGGSLLVGDGGEATLDGCSLGGALTVQTGSRADLINCDMTDPSGVSIIDGDCTLNGGSMAGGLIISLGGTFRLYGGELIGNGTAPTVYVGADALFEMVAGVVSGQGNTYHAVQVDPSGTFVYRDGVIKTEDDSYAVGGGGNVTDGEYTITFVSLQTVDFNKEKGNSSEYPYNLNSYLDHIEYVFGLSYADIFAAQREDVGFLFEDALQTLTGERIRIPDGVNITLYALGTTEPPPEEGGWLPSPSRQKTVVSFPNGLEVHGTLTLAGYIQANVSNFLHVGEAASLRLTNGAALTLNSGELYLFGDVDRTGLLEDIINSQPELAFAPAVTIGEVDLHTLSKFTIEGYTSLTDPADLAGKEFTYDTESPISWLCTQYIQTSSPATRALWASGAETAFAAVPKTGVYAALANTGAEPKMDANMPALPDAENADGSVRVTGTRFESALFHGGSPSGIARDADGAFLVTDLFNKCVWRVAYGEEPAVLVGRAGVKDMAGETLGGYNDGSYGEAAFMSPWALAPFRGGYLVSDAENNVVRWFGDGLVKTAVGSGKAALADGRGVAAAFSHPTGLAADDAGNIYIADTGNHRIRVMDKDGNVKTAAGSGAKGGFADGKASEALFDGPTGLAWAGGALYIADTGNHRIRKLENGTVTTVAGAGYAADSVAYYGGDYADGPAAKALFSGPTGVAVAPDGSLFVSDTGNSAVRMIQGGLVTTIFAADAGDPFPVAPRGLLAAADERLFVCDAFAGVVVAPPFADTQGHWAEGDIAFAAGRGLLTAADPLRFSPDETLTRGAFVTALYRLAGEPAVRMNDAFRDVDEGDRCYEAANWARQSGVVNGVGDGLFAPETPVTREQTATVLLAYARFAGLAPQGVWAVRLDFADVDQIADWATEGAMYCAMKGVIGGRPGKRFDPKAPVTKAEAAAMLRRFVSAEKTPAPATE